MVTLGTQPVGCYTEVVCLYSGIFTFFNDRTSYCINLFHTLYSSHRESAKRKIQEVVEPPPSKRHHKETSSSDHELRTSSHHSDDHHYADKQQLHSGHSDGHHYGNKKQILKQSCPSRIQKLDQHKSGDYWLSSDLVVKMVDRVYKKGRYYNTKVLSACILEAKFRESSFLVPNAKCNSYGY